MIKVAAIYPSIMNGNGADGVYNNYMAKYGSKELNKKLDGTN